MRIIATFFDKVVEVDAIDLEDVLYVDIRISEGVWEIIAVVIP